MFGQLSLRSWLPQVKNANLCSFGLFAALLGAAGMPSIAIAQIDGGTMDLMGCESNKSYGVVFSDGMLSSRGSIAMETWSFSPRFTRLMSSETKWLTSECISLSAATGAVSTFSMETPSSTAARTMSRSSAIERPMMSGTAIFEYQSLTAAVLENVVDDLYSAQDEGYLLLAAEIVDGDSGRQTGLLIMEVGPGGERVDHWFLFSTYRPPQPSALPHSGQAIEPGRRNGYAASIELWPVEADLALYQLDRVPIWARGGTGRSSAQVGWYTRLVME